jgi:hypothetical protein
VAVWALQPLLNESKELSEATACDHAALEIHRECSFTARKLRFPVIFRLA